MIQFLKLQYLLNKITKEQLIDLMGKDKLTIDEYLYITKEGKK